MKSIIKNPWFIALIGVIMLDLLIWLAGPLIAIANVAILEGVATRAVICLIMLLIWLTAFLAVRWAARQSGEKLAQELVAPKAGTAGGTSPLAQAEVEQLSQRMKSALEQLKKAGGGSRGQYLYQIPWYVIIGPPGAGKTTALRNCGLRFPAESANALQGVGGTRNCDWWFSEQAVFLDTAGRYTTQDSDADADQAEWLGFLDILKKYRRRQPVNGVLLAISIEDVLRFNETERKAHALAIRKRISELNDRLGLRLPIYVVFTKMDMLAGFVQFFDDMGKEDRAQVWGTTFPLDEGRTGETVAAFAAEFDALATRLGERLTERLQTEGDVGRRGAILDFPQQFGLIRQPVKEMMEDIFSTSRFEGRTLLRGVYFTSATQVGAPIDRLLGSMASSFGLRQAALPAFTGQGRSYFLSRLLMEVIFPEAGIVGSNRGAEQRQRLLRVGAAAASLVAALGAIAALTVSYLGNAGLVEKVAAEASKYSGAAASASPTATDWRQTAVLLEQARGLPTGYDEAGQPVPLSLTFGLYQGDKLGMQAGEAYRRALHYLLLPKLLNRLEGQIRSRMNQPEFLFESLQIYMMLGKRAELRAPQVTQWYGLDIPTQFPTPDQEPVRQALTRHIEALIGGDFVALPLDDTLIEQARAVLRQISPAQRAYSLIKQSSAASRLPEWSPTAKSGPAAPQVLRRVSGRPLTEGIPGLFTREGFHKVFLPQTPEMVREMLAEAQLIDKRAANPLDQAQQAAQVQREVLSLYHDEYARRWDALLADVAIVPFRNIDHAAEVLNILGGPTSPLKQLIVAAADETLLTQPPASAGSLAAAAAEGAGKLLAKDERLSKLMGAAGSETVAAFIPGKLVEERFRRLRDMTQGSPSQIDAIVETLARLYRQTSKMAAAGSQGAAMLSAAGGADGNVAQILAGEAANMPAPIGGMLGAVAKNSNALTVGGARSQLNALWQSSVLPFCQQALTNRYPFNRTSSVEVTVEDFTRLFAASGMIPQFFNTNIARFVDTSRRPWRWTKVDSAELGLSQEALAQFERAMAISDGFFRGGGTLQVNFELAPLSLDIGANEVVFEVSGQRLAYSHGPAVPVRMQWPSQSGFAQTTLSMSPPVPGKTSSIVKDGPWSLFRVLEDATFTPGPVPERFKFGVMVSGRTASFELRASSVNNPFNLQDLRQFRCPANL